MSDIDYEKGIERYNKIQKAKNDPDLVPCNRCEGLTLEQLSSWNGCRFCGGYFIYAHYQKCVTCDRKYLFRFIGAQTVYYKKVLKGLHGDEMFYTLKGVQCRDCYDERTI